MDTKLVKQYIIVILLLLNIVLFIINISEEPQYAITRVEEQSLITHLEQNNIILNTNIIQDYLPMPKVSMKKTIYNQDDLLEIFFSKELNSGLISDLTSSSSTNTDIFDNISNNNNNFSSFNNDKFVYKNKSLEVTNNNLFFQDLNTMPDFKYSKENALVYADYYANLLSIKYGDLIQDIILQKDDYILITYANHLNKFQNFSNSLYIKIYETGRLDLYFTDYDKAEVTTSNVGIYSIFEVMHVFSKEVPNLIQDEQIYIENIDLGYYIKDKNENIYLSFEPCYRIFISNSEVPFFINAYTNTFEYDVNFII